MEDKFISRIDGVDKKRSDYGPTINEAEGLIVGQGSMPNLFRRGARTRTFLWLK